MKNKPKICKGCWYFNNYYGNRDKKGKRTVSGFWCIARNGRIKTNLKACNYRKEKVNGRIRGGRRS